MTRLITAAVAATCVLTVLVLGAALAWKHVVVALAITAVSYLAVSVVLQRVAPLRAIASAATALMLMMSFSWLALQFADPLLFGRKSNIVHWFEGFCGELVSAIGIDSGLPAFLVAVGASFLFAACFLASWMKPAAVFLGSLLVFCFVPVVFEEKGLFVGELFYHHDPAFKFAIYCTIVIGIVGIVRLLSNAKQSNHITKEN